MDKYQIIIDCPNKVEGYPPEHTGRKRITDGIVYCSKTRKTWNDYCIFIGGYTEFVHVQCECQK